MSGEISNRVEAEVLRWKEKEERFSTVFSFAMSTNKALIREKLRDYEAISLKYRGTLKPDERLTLRMLKQERRQLERQLHPYLLFRLGRRWLVNPVRNFFVRRAARKQLERQRESLNYQMNRIGLGKHFGEAERMMRQRGQKFSMPVSYYTDERQRVDHTLQFEMNGRGIYQAVSLEASLRDADNPKKIIKQTFDLKQYPGIGTREAINLLEGRSVMVGEKWLQLDSNDKDTQGNYRIRELTNTSVISLTDTLNVLPFKELSDENERMKLQTALKRGDRVPLTLLKAGHQQRFYIEANPRLRSVNLLDENKQSVSLAELSGRKISPVQSQKQGIKNGAKRPGIRIA